MTGIIILLAVVGISAIIVIMGVSMHNKLVRKRNEVDNAFGGVDVQLKKRYDLIPNLVATVKQYATHEKETLTNIAEMRSKASSGNLSNDEKVALDNKISAGMHKIMVAVEDYPDLKANESFMNLQRSLTEVESQISAARRTYNAVITDFNNTIQIFPNSIVAGMMKLQRKEVFVITVTERKNIDVKSLF